MSYKLYLFHVLVKLTTFDKAIKYFHDCHHNLGQTVVDFGCNQFRIDVPTLCFSAIMFVSNVNYPVPRCILFCLFCLLYFCFVFSMVLLLILVFRKWEQALLRALYLA